MALISKGISIGLKHLTTKYLNHYPSGHTQTPYSKIHLKTSYMPGINLSQVNMRRGWAAYLLPSKYEECEVRVHLSRRRTLRSAIGLFSQSCNDGRALVVDV